MSTILPIDTEIAFPSAVVVSASAGSGKTYTLTQRLVQLLLSDHVPNNGLKNIIAITFTNQAASEMRSRLIVYLKKLSIGDPDLLAEAEEFLSLTPDRIREKADTVLLRILNEYSDLQIQTIDSFMATVFKTSAFEFGHQPDLDIVIDNRPLLAEAFARLTRRLRDDPRLRKTLTDTMGLINETKRGPKFLWDPWSKIGWEVKSLYSKLAAREQELLDGGGLDELAQIKEELRVRATALREALDSSTLRPQKKVERDLADVEEGNPEKLFKRVRITLDNIVLRPKGGVHAARHEELLQKPLVVLEQFNRSLDTLFLWHARNYYEPYVNAIRFVESTLDQLKRERGQIFIDDVNRLLRPRLKEGGAVDAYLMLGEQIHHFLIDEFQDTSPIQWANLKPLIENSLSQGGSLFVVGDRKQSIYSFRDADWRIMDRLMKGEVFPAAKAEVLTLKDNWRSGEKIIDYTGYVFEETVARSEYAGAAALSGLNAVKQIPKEENKGKGHFEVLVHDYNEELTPEKDEVIGLIRSAMQRGYSYRHIAILTPQNDRVMQISTWLNQMEIPVLPYSSLDIRSRKVIAELVALLRFLESPVDDLSFATFLAGDAFGASLSETGTVPEDRIHAFLMDAARQPERRRLYVRFREQFPDLWAGSFEQLFRLVGYLPVYDLLSDLYRRFRVFDRCASEEASLVRLLDVVRAFGESDRNSLSDFLEAVDEEGEQSLWQVQVPREVDAVRVMTVHKAKGLEFPVTIVVHYDRDRRPSRYYFNDTPEGTYLLHIRSESAENHVELNKIYVDQKISDIVDELNKLYVSLTRAQHELYVIALRGVREPLFPSPLLVPPPGQIELRPQADVRPQSSREPAVAVHSMHDIGLDEEGYRVPALTEKARGNVVHEILGRIVSVDGDPSTAVDLAMQSHGTEIPRGVDRGEVRRSIISFLGVPRVREFFAPAKQRIVFTEKEFVDREGALFRMDRVLVDPDSVTVVDFKTGSRPASEYAEQMHQYRSILRDLFPGRPCRSALAYVDKGTVSILQ